MHEVTWKGIRKPLLPTSIAKKESYQQKEIMIQVAGQYNRLVDMVYTGIYQCAPSVKDVCQHSNLGDWNHVHVDHWPSFVQLMCLNRKAESETGESADSTRELQVESRAAWNSWRPHMLERFESFWRCVIRHHQTSALMSSISCCWFWWPPEKHHSIDHSQS